MVTKKDVREYLATIGSRGGRKGSRDNKVRAARVRWDKHRTKATAENNSK